MLRWSLRFLRSRPVVGGLASVALHLLLFSTLFLMGSSWVTPTVKRGEPLFIELPQIDEPAPRGNPAAKAPGPPAQQPPKVAEAPKAPPAPKPAPARRPVPPPPRSEAPRVASAAPVPKPEVGELPAPTPAAAQPAREPAPPAPPRASEPARPEPPAPPREQVAMTPPSREPGPDIRSALGRGGGAGGRDDGRGGIEGEPIPLESKDPKYSDYLDRVRRMIKAKWSYPCVKNAVTHECEYKSAQLVIEFGIAKDGRVPFVTVRQSSGHVIMDDYAVNAIKLASPFPAVPDILGKKGIPILASFHYVIDNSLVNLLR